MRFDQTRFAAFDLHILKRPGAEADYSESQRAAAKAAYAAMSQENIDYLVMVIARALPGSTAEPRGPESIVGRGSDAPRRPQDRLQAGPRPPDA